MNRPPPRRPTSTLEYAVYAALVVIALVVFGLCANGSPDNHSPTKPIRTVHQTP